LDVIPEQEEPDLGAESDGYCGSDCEEIDEMQSKTVVFGGVSGVHPGFKYDPVALQNALFPGSRPRDGTSRPPRKRRRLSDLEDVESMDVDAVPKRDGSPASSNTSSSTPSNLFLETATEIYLLTRLLSDSTTEDQPSTKPEKCYTLSLILQSPIAGVSSSTSEQQREPKDSTLVPSTLSAAAPSPLSSLPPSSPVPQSPSADPAENKASSVTPRPTSPELEKASSRALKAQNDEAQVSVASGEEQEEPASSLQSDLLSKTKTLYASLGLEEMRFESERVEVLDKETKSVVLSIEVQRWRWKA